MDEKQTAEVSEEQSQDQAPAAVPQDEQTQEVVKTQDGERTEGEKSAETQADDKQKVNSHKLERDLANSQKRVKELEAQLAKSTEGTKTTEERLAELEQKLKDAEAERDREKLNASLIEAKCIDTKAAAARLDEFDGDIAALKEAAPYLFEAKTVSVSTGGAPKGKPGKGKDEILSIKDPKERQAAISANKSQFSQLR